MNKTRIIIISLIVLLSIMFFKVLNYIELESKTKYQVIALNNTQPIAMEVKIEKKIIQQKKTKTDNNRQNTTKSDGTYKLTHYGYDCCKSGKTATGWDARNIYYNDSEYGELRIFATSKAIPLYSVIEIEDYKFGKITGIVLDRGVGNGVIDILVENEKTASQYGIQKGVKVEIIRRGR